MRGHSILSLYKIWKRGRTAIAAVLKTVGCNSPVGSNPTASARRKMKIPDKDASIEDICAYALEFIGYKYVNVGPEELANLYDEVAKKGIDNATVDELRACLFWEQRGLRYHSQLEGDGIYEELREFLNAIRHKLE